MGRNAVSCARPSRRGSFSLPVPAFGTRDGVLPLCVQLLSSGTVHLRGEYLAWRTGLGDLFHAVPEAGREPGKVRSALCRGFKDRRTFYLDAQQIGLKLHEHIVGGSTAVRSQFTESTLRIGFHGTDDIRDLKRDALKGSPGDVPNLCAALQADDHATGIRVPVRRTQAREGRHEYDLIGALHGRGNGLNVGRILETLRSLG